MTGLTEMVYACAYIAFDFGNASWLVLLTYCGVILSCVTVSLLLLSYAPPFALQCIAWYTGGSEGV